MAKGKGIELGSQTPSTQIEESPHLVDHGPVNHPNTHDSQMGSRDDSQRPRKESSTDSDACNLEHTGDSHKKSINVSAHPSLTLWYHADMRYLILGSSCSGTEAVC